MKIINKITATLLLATSAIFGNAQSITLDCESAAPFFQRTPTNNIAFDRANCWALGAFSYIRTTVSLPSITGTFSARGNSMSNENANSSAWIKSPWIKMASGNITLNIRMEGTSGTGGALGSGSYKAIRIRLVTYDPNVISSSKEGSFLADSFTYLIQSPYTNVQNISYAVPASIVGNNNVYKVMISFIGAGGNNRAIADDIVIPGTYWSNPSNNCLPQALIVDADNDGVQDSDDAYPNDAARAYNNVFPSSGYSTLMFEDLWPSLGDYDFNDFVVDYKLNRVTNAANKVVEIKAEFVSRAAGASRPNGFAFSFDGLANSKITGVTGNKIFTPNPHTFNANGTEAGQTDAHFVVVSNIFKVLIPQGGGSGGVNTNPTAVRVPNDTTRMTIAFNTTTNTTNLSEVTLAKFNPYLIVNQTRGTEIHLADKAPSSLVNSALLGTADDNSNAGSNRFYKTKNNLPWAINVTSSIPYMKETIDFTKGYNNFIDWSLSNGTTNTDWYLNLSNFRDNNNLY